MLLSLQEQSTQLHPARGNDMRWVSRPQRPATRKPYDACDKASTHLLPIPRELSSITCGDGIPAPRLQDVPWTQFCLPCQEAIEQEVGATISPNSRIDCHNMEERRINTLEHDGFAVGRGLGEYPENTRDNRHGHFYRRRASNFRREKKLLSSSPDF
jgi:hypothetical protein